jgi:quercetin dioxygenase-like cupin family protein
VNGKIVVSARDGGWEPSRIPGVSFRLLHPAKERNAGTFLVKMEPGTRYPPHEHPGGEEVFVVAGSMTVGGEDLSDGDYLYTPPGGAHDASTTNGCVFLVVLPSPAKFLA